MQADDDAFDVDGGGGGNKALCQRRNNSDNQSNVIEIRYGLKSALDSGTTVGWPQQIMVLIEMLSRHKADRTACRKPGRCATGHT